MNLTPDDIIALALQIAELRHQRDELIAQVRQLRAELANRQTENSEA